MNKCLDAVVQKASWKKAVLFTILFAVFYILINYSGTGVAGLLRVTGGASILDFEFGYTQGKAFDMLTALGAEGRVFYLTKILPVDFPFPFAYMLFYSGWIALLIKEALLNKRFPEEAVRVGWHKYLLLIPVLAMLSDWMENVGIITMLRGYPHLPEWAVMLASDAGMIKTVFTIASIAVIVLLLIAFLINKYAEAGRLKNRRGQR